MNDPLNDAIDSMRGRIRSIGEYDDDIDDLNILLSEIVDEIEEIFIGIEGKLWNRK